MEKTTMKAVIATGYGAPEVLAIRDIQIPTPKEKQVLIKVVVASTTRADGMMRTGKPYFGRLFTGISKPKNPIPGTGFAGEIVDTGRKVTLFNIGEMVFGETTLGFSTNAEYVVVPEDGVILHKPENMSFAEAATFCDGHLTSINFLKEIAKIKAGQKVLINGASGSLGTAAVQLAKYYGAHVTGVCSERNIGLVKSLGADRVIDYNQEDFTRSDESYDIIFDTVGKSSFSESQKVLTTEGLYISPVLKFSLLMQMLKTSLFGRKKAKFAASGLKSDHELKDLLVELVEIYNQGKIRSIIDRQFPLENVVRAHRYIANGHKRGNVVLTIQN
ncbi:MAG: NAD(P)-dependent alcohol dehydrogenase [Saprospiraceae bacterium]|nr:NAD(P)-dependent alcohol dehydrogenase [Saprospiraceae bacterium]